MSWDEIKDKIFQLEMAMVDHSTIFVAAFHIFSVHLFDNALQR